MCEIFATLSFTHNRHMQRAFQHEARYCSGNSLLAPFKTGPNVLLINQFLLFTLLHARNCLEFPFNLKYLDMNIETIGIC